MLEQALKYLDKGWSVIPTSPSDKKPLIAWKPYQQRRPTSEEVRKWWKLWPTANIGIVTGKVSGLVVVDVDAGRGGAKSVLKIFDQKEIESTLHAKTGGGGWHLYFNHPGVHVDNKVDLFQGVDIRGDGGYVVAPRSIHSSGKRYEWTGNGRLRPYPKVLIDKETGNGKLKSEDWKSEIQEGARDDELTRRTGKLLSQGIPPKEVFVMMMAWNKTHCFPPLPQEQVAKIVKSIAKRENVKADGGKGFRVLGFADALKRYGLEEPSWSIENWLPEATCGLVVAPPGTFKTWLFLNLAYSVATGKPFLGVFTPRGKPRPVLIIQQEDPLTLLFSRLCSMMNIGEILEENGVFTVPKPPDPPEIYWHPDRKLRFTNPDAMEGIEEAIKAYRPGLVLIDPLYASTDAKDYMSDAAQNMLALKDLRDRYKCSFLIAHHTTKRTGDNPNRLDLWGSQFLNAWLETGWQIRPEGQKGVLIRRHFKQSGITPLVRLAFDITPYKFKVDVVDDVPEHAVKNDEEKIFLELIGTNTIRSEGDVHRATGMPKANIHRLFKKFKLEQNIGGRYEVPEGIELEDE